MIMPAPMQQINFRESVLHTTQRETFATVPHVQWGKSNTYPQVMRDAVSLSATAQACQKWLFSFIRGEGFSDERLNSVIFNQELGITGSKLLEMIARQVAFIPAISLHFDFNFYGQIAKISPVPIDYVRVGSVTDPYYSKKIAVWDDWAGESAKMFNSYAEVKYFSAFGKENPDENGAVYYMPLDSDRVYPAATADAVMQDLIFDNQVSLFRSRTAQNNFTPSTVAEVLGAQKGGEKINSIKERFNFFQGAENSGGMLWLEGGMQDENGVWHSAIQFHTPQLQQFDGVYDKTVTHAEERILRAYNLPAPLLSVSSAGRIGITKDMISDCYSLYNQFTADIREAVARNLSPIISNFVGTEVDCSIKPKTFA